MKPQGKQSDLLPDELKSIIATIFMLPVEQVEDWLIVVKQPCTNCGRDYCGDGQIATVSSRSAVHETGAIWHEPDYELHLASKLIDSLAGTWRDERDERREVDR